MLARYWEGLTESLQRTVIRQMMSAGGTQLKKEIERQVKSSVSSQASSRGGPVRYRGNEGSAIGYAQMPLAKTIRKKPWSQRHRGIIGMIVGAMYPEGAQAHLVERGHRVISWGKPTGKMTRALRFQMKAAQVSKGAIFRAQENKMSQAILKQRNKAMRV